MLGIVGGLGQAESVRAFCLEHTTRTLAGKLRLPPELADEIVRIAARQGGAALHAALRAAVATAVTPQARRRWLLALAEFPSQREIALSLAATVDGKLAPAVDRAALWIALFSRPQSADASWSWLQRRFKQLEREWPPILIARLVGATSAALAPDRAGEIAKFFRTHPLAAGPRTLRQVGEELALARRFEPELGRQLARYLGPSIAG